MTLQGIESPSTAARKRANGGRAVGNAGEGSLFDKLDRVHKVLAPLRRHDVDPLTIEIEEVRSATEAVILGQTTCLFGTNNYLGMNYEPSCVEAASDALHRFGTGTTASRVASGSHHAHLSLEKEIAAFFDRQSAILFSTGFQANLGVISGLTGPGDVIMIDRDCHASILDGCVLGGATVVPFDHNSPEDLVRKIEETEVPGGRIMIIVEGLYSVAGDIAPLKEFAEIRDRYGACLLVDEAHSFGLFGENGRGIAEMQGVEDKVDLIVGTFSKSVGVIGGFCVSNHPKFEDLRFLARAYLYTASLPPPIVGAARAAFKRIRNGQDLRERLNANIDRLYTGLVDMGFEPLSPPSPVISLRVPRMSAGYEMWRTLLQEGILVNYMVPPSTPGPYSVLRCSVSAAHTDEQISTALAAFGSISHHLEQRKAASGA